MADEPLLHIHLKIFSFLFYAYAWRFGIDQGQASLFFRVTCVFFADLGRHSLSFPVSICSPNFMSATSLFIMFQAQFEWFLRPPLRYFMFLWEWTVVTSLYFLRGKPGSFVKWRGDSENSDAGAAGMGGCACRVHSLSNCFCLPLPPPSGPKKPVLHFVVHCAFPNVVQSQGIKFNLVRLSFERPETMVFWKYMI